MKKPTASNVQRKLTADQRRELAAAACYVGSPEHKDGGWWGGRPSSRQLSGGRVGRGRAQTTTICPLSSKEDRSRATDWVRSAIMAGQYRFFQSDKKYPKKMFFEADDQIWCGYCVNSVLGQYKGWPIDEEERREIFG